MSLWKYTEFDTILPDISWHLYPGIPKTRIFIAVFIVQIIREKKQVQNASFDQAKYTMQAEEKELGYYMSAVF